MFVYFSIDLNLSSRVRTIYLSQAYTNSAPQLTFQRLLVCDVSSSDVITIQRCRITRNAFPSLPTSTFVSDL